MTASQKKPFVSLKTAAEGGISGVKKETNFQVAPHLIEIEPGFNRPISRSNVEQFKTAIRNGATIPPIFVRVDAGRIIMVDGEHRMIAILELIAEGMEIPSMSATQFRGNDADRIAHQLTSAQGEPHSPLDAGIQYLKLIRLNWDSKRIAGRIGRSVTHIEQCILLAESNTDVQQAVRNGDVSGTMAVSIIKEQGSNAGVFIKEQLASAKASGKTKVTAKTMQGSALPRKLVSRVTQSIGSLFSSIPGMTLQSLAGMDGAATVPVPARVLQELMAAHEEVNSLRLKKSNTSTDGSV